MGVHEALTDALRAAYATAPETIAPTVSRVLAENGCRSLIVMLPPGMGYPLVQTTVRLEDINRTAAQQLFAVLFRQMGMEEYGNTAALVATEALMRGLEMYRARQAQGGAG
jgi:hypothetical protein